MKKTAGKKLLQWYHQAGRDLPWRADASPYHVWLSEIMLQQTRIEAVREYYARFLAECPDLRSLASCEEGRLMKLWEGLGYYSRARNLKKTALILAESGTFPETAEELRKLPGIGPYTAGAIASIAFGKRTPAVDGNVLRVLSRLEGKNVERKEAEELLLSVFPPEGKEASAFTQAWMELGETVCIPNGVPQCSGCPLQKECIARKEGTIDLFPAPREKKERKTEDRTVFLLECQGKYAIGKRPGKGLLASLWEFPSVCGHLSETETAAFFAAKGISVKKLDFLCEAAHIFTHIEWHMHCWKAVLEFPVEEWIWAEPEELETKYALPSAFSAVRKHI